MIFRCRLYQMLPDKVESYNQFFDERLLPLQQRHGARLVARLQDERTHRILAVWAYESIEEFHDIQSRVRSDPDHASAMEYRSEQVGTFCSDWEEWFMTSTVPLESTLLSHLIAPGLSCSEMAACAS